MNVNLRIYTDILKKIGNFFLPRWRGVLNTTNQYNRISSIPLSGIINGAAVHIVLCLRDQTFFNRVLMDVIQFLVSNSIAPKFNWFVVRSPKPAAIGCLKLT